MPNRYQDNYPEAPLIRSADLVQPLATDLLTLEFFEAGPGEIPQKQFSQYPI